jgi:arylsulfatase A-like enzyme
MKRVMAGVVLLVTIQVGGVTAAALQNSPSQPRRNVVIFIADGLRHDSITEDVAPTMFHLRQQGVDFANSHSLYPTFTTPNASAFATGHLLGDTGDFGNALYVGHPLSQGPAGGTLTPFIENDLFLAKLNGLYNGNYLGETTLTELARSNGYFVVVIGKLGPAAIQDASEIKVLDNVFESTQATIIDDSTGANGIPLPAKVKAEMGNAGLSATAPDRANGQDPAAKTNNGRSGTLSPNLLQQHYFADAATHAALPIAVKDGKPFLLIYWSRDPDGSQHNQGDSLGKLTPGINGPTSRAAIHNADDNLWQIIDYLKSNNLYTNTDIVVVADHGFSTISKQEISVAHTATKSYSATLTYPDVQHGSLPPGFLAIDLAHALNEPLYDPDAASSDSAGFYRKVDSSASQHPGAGNGGIGGTGRIPGANEITDAQVIVAANGGSDLIYLPQVALQKQLAQRIAEFLVAQDYVDGIFVRDDLGDLPGTLPLSAVGLMGATNIPKPAFLVNFKSFSQDQRSLLSRVEISDTTLQQGQGMHGSFSRADTFNAMLASGPDFKSGYTDHAPSSNADIAVTVASLLKWNFPESKGKLRGRVLAEALKGNAEARAPQQQQQRTSSRPGANGLSTVLMYQTFAGHTYFDQGCLIDVNKDRTCQ